MLAFAVVEYFRFLRIYGVMIILDIEASGLAPQSYPIEIAWQHRFNPTLFDSFLIKPADRWVFWDQYAEDHIHHISRLLLEAKGISVFEAAERLNAALRDKQVYVDAPDYDRRWMAELFRAAGVEKQFELQSVYSLVSPSKEAAYQRHFTRSPVAHRALEDVRQIIESLNYIAPEQV